ncbi:MAG: tRNA (adenosine(37)-N6)-threonylcarbamoyltransferase complex transferase subunit TsaD, partial [Atopobiaceae bacterium]|nr:tRNA (adenosine(37)-N6)-threonylcarbamoyltransferase complex transferase subunit TsaD [Atopobiaceae bacterium]
TITAAGDLILAIESSCDETAVAVIDEGGRVLSSIVATQIDLHARFGGVVPEIASRKHTEAIVGTFEEALAKAGEQLGVDTLTPADLSAVAVTAGPGLVGALVVGVAFAKGLCAATGLPLIAVHHLEGHLFANLFETPDLEPPFVASLVSGGNTMLVHVRAWGDYEILGTTIDDAVGEAFDKVAKALGLGYPGGPVISKLAAQGNPRAIAFPRAMMHSHDYRFSLSGLKTAVITYIEGENRAGRPINLPDLAASFQAAVVDVQVAKAVTAVEELGVSDFCVGGGVAANPALRAAYQKAFGKRGVRVTVPPLSVCGDNAAMIALVALRSYKAGLFADLSLDANPNAPLGTWSVTG